MIEPSSEKIRIPTLRPHHRRRKRAPLRCGGGERGDLHEYPTNIHVHAQTNEKEARRAEADPGGEAGWNHHFTKAARLLRAESPPRSDPLCTTVRECAKVRQATVFLAQRGPMETEQIEKSNEFRSGFP